MAYEAIQRETTASLEETALTPGETSAEASATVETNGVTNARLTRTIEKAVRGDQGAFSVLYRHYLKEVIYYAQMLLVDKAAAEDVAQVAILSVHRNLAKLESPYAFRAYLMRAVHNASISHNRRAYGRREQAGVSEELVETLADEGDTPEASVEKKLLNEAIRRVVNALPTQQRLTVYLHYYDGLTYQEIAGILQTTTATVGTNLLKARRKLKQMIERDNIVSESEIVPGEARSKAAQDATTHAATTHTALPSKATQDATARAALQAKTTQPEDRQRARIVSSLNTSSDTLCGQAMAPAVTLALGEGIESAISEQQVLHVAGAIDKTLASQALQPAASLAARASASSGAYSTGMRLVGALLTGLLAAGLLGIIFMSANQNRGALAQEDEPGQTIIVQGSYQPEAEIVFVHVFDSATGAALLSEASVDLSDGTALSWALYNENNEELFQGIGAYATDIFTTLEPGSYRLEWITASDTGGQALVTRSFIVN
jgi:RNA polymerase sigma-70 factor (ECF subfamily)